jgi:hypothetical protein
MISFNIGGLKIVAVSILMIDPLEASHPPANKRSGGGKTNYVIAGIDCE